MLVKRNLLAAGLFLALGLCVWQSDAVRNSVLSAGERCLTVLIPSLYAFSFLAGLCVSAGALETVAKPLGKYGDILAILLFSQIGGYPVGAQLLHERRLRGELIAEDERRLLCVCIGCGPGFLLGTVCAGFPPKLTLWLMLSVSLPNFVFAPFLVKTVESSPKRQSLEPFAVQFTRAAEGAANAMLKVTAMVLIFAAGMGILDGVGLFALLPGSLGNLLRGVLEVSCVTGYLQSGGSLPVAAALLSFGGVCVHMQLCAICEGNVAMGRLFLTRLAAAAMSWGLCALGLQFWFRDALETSLLSTRTALTTGSPLPGLCLLLMAVLLLRKRENPSG